MIDFCIFAHAVLFEVNASVKIKQISHISNTLRLDNIIQDTIFFDNN